MHVPFLCVQFRNVLPSEELLRHARSLWTELQEQVRCRGGSEDAMLSITQNPGESCGFEVELSLPGVLRAAASDRDALTAIDRVFTQLPPGRPLQEALVAVSVVGKSATLGTTASLPDTSRDVP